VIRFQHILCPVDFSETSDRALHYATALAAWYEAQLTILHVVQAFEAHLSSSAGSDERGSGPFPSRDEVMVEMRRAIERSSITTVIPSLLIDEGRVHATIVDRAASLPADLLVLGTHGRGGFERLFLGSVAEKVLRSASCPVLTIPPSVHATPRIPVTFGKILCATDFLPSSRRALEYALDLARQADGSVTVLHALEYMDEDEPCEHVDAQVRDNRRQIIEHAHERVRSLVSDESRTWCDIKDVVEIGRAYRLILQRAAAADIDLIAMGAQGLGGVELMIYGSNTQHVVRQATCPVLTIRA
jgi:nucleotide-binding universal stress UspA family protein